MSYIVSENFPHPILDLKEGPFISVYIPTSRVNTEAHDNSVRYKNQLKNIEIELEKKYDRKDFDSLFTTLKDLGNDKDFWNYQLDGLGVLAAKDQCVVFKLQREVKEFSTVSDTFYIKPLLNAYQTDDSYQILALNRNDFKLYEGNRYAIREIVIPPEEKKSFKEIVGTFYEEEHKTQISMGSSGKTMFGGGGGSTRDEEAIDAEKYFRYIDRLVEENYSKKTGLPLILASLTEYHAEFAKLSHNSYLMKEGIKKDPGSLSPEDLKNSAWKIMEPIYYNNIEKLSNKYELAKSKENASADISEVARAALESRVDVLLINLDKIVPGKISLDNDRLLSEEENGDMLNDLALLALKQKAKVFVVPEDKMISDTGVMSIFRYTT